jgi:hypothetical protein
VTHFHPIKLGSPANVEALRRFITVTEAKAGVTRESGESATSGREIAIARVRRVTRSQLPNASRQFRAHTRCRAPLWAVVTTINAPTLAIEQLARMNGTCLVVVGDVRSPRYPPNSRSTVFLSFAEQLTMNYSVLGVVGANSFARAAVGYLYAIQHGAEVIYDFDDDNSFINASVDLLSFNGMRMELTSQASRVVNPYAFYGGSGPIWPRGFPLQLVKGPPPVAGLRRTDSASVVQFLQNVNPDLDAIYRLTHGIPEAFNPKKVDCVSIDPVKFVPFNAQSTLFGSDAFFGLALPTSVNGRVADIWRSYIAERILRVEGGRVAFCPAIVEHHRNQHDLMRDFNAELPLYQQALPLLAFLDEKVQPRKGESLPSLREFYISLIEHGILNEKDLTFVDAWIIDYLDVRRVRKK